MPADSATPIEGEVARGFEPVRTAFAAAFARNDAFRELGAGVAAYHRGRCVVDLWGGHSDLARTRPWRRETLVNVWSATKGATAACVARLVDGGALRYEDTVASVWPEFAQNGKADITVAQMMSHQAGLPGFAEPTTLDDQYDWEGCCAKLARQAPAWPPGTASSYHAMTFGWLAGEIVRRVSGMSVGDYLRREIAEPLEADVHIGLPEALEPRVAELAGPLAAPPDGGALPQYPARLAIENPMQDPAVCNTRAWREAQIPAANGHASALGLARLYAGMLEDGRVFSVRGLEAMTRRATQDGRVDMLMGFVDSWGMGVMLNPEGAYGPGARAFGHSGWGGSFGCADPDLELSIGYVCNQMGSELIIDPRSIALARAITACAAAA